MRCKFWITLNLMKQEISVYIRVRVYIMDQFYVFSFILNVLIRVALKRMDSRIFGLEPIDIFRYIHLNLAFVSCHWKYNGKRVEFVVPLGIIGESTFRDLGFFTDRQASSSVQRTFKFSSRIYLQFFRMFESCTQVKIPLFKGKLSTEEIYRTENDWKWFLVPQRAESEP